MKERGSYVTYVQGAEGVIPLKHIVFTIHERSGLVQYDPDLSGRRAISAIYGTSFSTPYCLANYLKKKEL